MGSCLVADPLHCPPPLLPLPFLSTLSIPPKGKGGPRSQGPGSQCLQLPFCCVTLDDCSALVWASVLSKVPPLALKSYHLSQRNLWKDIWLSPISVSAVWEDPRVLDHTKIARAPAPIGFSPLKNIYIYLFLETGEGREKEKERNINVWLPLTCPQWEPGPQPRRVP